jgi:hypothetical protein
MPQNSITPDQKAQAVNLGGMMAHVEAVMQRYTSEMLQPLGLSVVSGQLCQTYTVSDQQEGE